MTLKIAVCDDLPTDRQRLISLIKSKVPDCEITEYESGEALLRNIESGARFDMIFLDIFMDGISGVEAAGLIRKFDSDALLVFVSISDDFYRESYDLYAFNYLVKPLEKDKLNEVLTRAMEQLNKDTEQVVRISFMGSLHTVSCSQILYLSSEQHSVNFYLKNGGILKSYSKLDDFVSQLPSEDFVRCHQSYIVNLNQVTTMTTGKFALGEISVPISRSYSRQARDKYRAQIFGDF